MKRAIHKILVGQFGRPSGLLGQLAGLIMSKRKSNIARIEKTIHHLKIKPTDHILEIGYGPGISIETLSRLAHRGRVVGIDHSKLMVKTASKRNRQAIARDRVQLLLASVEDLPPINGCFDKIIGINVHMFWRDLNRVITYLRGIARPGGTIALTIQPRNRGAERDDAIRAGDRLFQAFKAAGLENIETALFDLYPVAAVCVSGQNLDPPTARV